jgi:inner membrane protein
MDSLTQIALGGTVAALAVPAGQRRKALLAGAALGTLPDLDVIPLMLAGVDPVTSVTWHRGPSHSLLVLAVAGWLLWLLLRRWWTPVRQQPVSWLWAIQLALLTHPLLDALTVYGTQLVWPLPPPPVMGSALFIIDPAYTLPLLVGCLAAWRLKERRAAHSFLVAGLALSTAYVGWALAAKAMVERTAEQALAAQGLQDAPRFSVPMPFNTVLWRVVVMTPTGFLEGERSLIADQGPMRFRHYTSDRGALDAVAAFPSVQRLSWFTHGFMKAEQREGRLVLSDLRMGAEPDYSFRYAVAEKDGNDGWRRIAVERPDWPAQERSPFAGMWQRIWHEPSVLTPGTAGSESGSEPRASS